MNIGILASHEGTMLQAVLAAREDTIGVSVHLVDEEYGRGAVIAQMSRRFHAELGRAAVALVVWPLERLVTLTARSGRTEHDGLGKVPVHSVVVVGVVVIGWRDDHVHSLATVDLDCDGLRGGAV